MTRDRVLTQVVGLVCAIVFLLIMVLNKPTVLAQNLDSESDGQSSQTDQATDNAAFNYTANPGDNLTLLVRRSIQLYTEENGVDLKTPALIAAETNVVNNMGSFEIAVNENVSIPEPMLIEATQASTQLSTAQLNAWSKYEPITTNLQYIKPDSAPDYVQTVNLSDNALNATDTDISSESSISNDGTVTESSSVWWLAGIAAIAGMFYLLGGKEYLNKILNRLKS